MHRYRLRYLLGFTAVLALTVTGIATGATGDPIREGQRNPASGFASAETQLLSNNASGYTARFSNFNSSDGGGILSACRATIANEPCLTVGNVNNGRAFSFATNGGEAGRINVSDPSARPFTTNATGVATGLNADKVDGTDLQKVRFGGNIGSPLQILLFESNALTVELDCSGAFMARVRSVSDNGTVQISRVNTPADTSSTPAGEAAQPIYHRDPDFDTNQTQQLSETSTPSTGTLAYSSITGKTITLEYAVDFGAFAQGDCLFYGIAAVSG